MRGGEPSTDSTRTRQTRPERIGLRSLANCALALRLAEPTVAVLPGVGEGEISGVIGGEGDSGTICAIAVVREKSSATAAEDRRVSIRTRGALARARLWKRSNS